jgi:histone-lysine N-methyltransferase SETMAR
VCEYAGQRISVHDAISRTCKTSAAGSDVRSPDWHHNYVLVFKEHFSDGRSICTCLDPTRIGNVGRFINHSCGPNLEAFAVRVGGCQHPRVAFFAACEINIGDELTFSYQDSSSHEDDGSDRKPCCCGHADCKKWYVSDLASCAYSTLIFLCRLPYEPV